MKRQRGRGRAGGESSGPQEPERLLMDLLALPGISGEEAAVARYITDRLRRAGVPEAAIRTDQAHRRGPHGGQVGNLVCKLPGSRRGPRRLLMAHMDTVPLCRGAVPVRAGGVIRPREKTTALGADDRGGVAVVLATAVALARRRLAHPPVTFLWTIQEEVGLCGARYARLGLLGNPRLAFNFDGGDAAKVTVGATGGYRMTIRVQGLASHAGSAPEAGISAIAVAAKAIAALHDDGWHGLIQKGTRTGTSNIGIIHGGDATNVVAPEVEVRAEARSHDPAFRQRIVRAVERAFHQAARSVTNVRGGRGSVQIQGHLDYESFQLPEDDPSVLAAEGAIRAVGGEPVRAVANGGLDANWMTARGVPTVSLGCGQSDPHTPDERLDLGQFHQACRVALHLATDGAAP